MLLRTLVKTGIKSNKGSFLGIALLMLLASITLTFSLCIYADLNGRQAAALSESNAGDVLLTSSTSELTDGFIDDVRSLDKVSEVRVTESFVASTSYRSSKGKKLGNDKLGIAYMPWSKAINCNVFTNDGSALISHENATAPRTGQAYLPISVQTTLGVSLGDTVLITIGDSEHELEVSAFIEDPQLGSPFLSDMGQYLLSSEDFDSMLDEVETAAIPGSGLIQQVGESTSYPARTLNIYMTDSAREEGLTPSGFAEYINDNIDTETITTGFLSSETLTGYAMLVVTICCAVFLVFALLVYVITLVICVHAISSSIQENYANFAILKAVGVPNRTIRRSFAIQYFACILASTLVGLAVGYLLVEPALPLFALLTGVLAQNDAPPLSVYGASMLLLLVVILAVVLKTRRISRITPLAAFRSGLGDVHFSSLASVPAAGRPLVLRLAWRAITSSKRSYIGLFACSLLIGVFVMLTFGMGGSLRTMEDTYDAFGVWMSDVSVRIAEDGASIEDVEDAISEIAPIEHVWQEGFVMQNMNGESRSIVGLSDFSITTGITEGRAPAYDNEVVVGYKLAEDMDLNIGDELMLANARGEEQAYLVSGLLSAMFNAGYGILMTYDGLAELEPDGGEADVGSSADSADGTDGTDRSSDNEGESYQILLKDHSKADEAKALLEERFGDAVDTTDTGIFASSTDMMVLIHDMFIFIGYSMDVIAVLLVFVAVSLIIGRMFSSERRDLGIYRALGFRSRSLRLQFALRFLIVALAGCICAVLIVSAGGSWLTSQLFGTFGVTKFTIDTSLPMVAGLVAGLALVFFVAAFWGSRRIRRVPISILTTD